MAILSAASPSPPTPCPIKIVSNSMYIALDNAAPIVGMKYFKYNLKTLSFNKFILISPL